MEELALVRALRRLEAATGLRLPGVAALAAQVKVVPLAEREAAFREGGDCPHIFAVRAGLLKQFYTTPDGTEWIKSFTAEGDLFGCPIGFDTGRASFSSVAIEISVVESISWKAVDELARTDKAWQATVCQAFRALTRIKMQRERDLLMFTPEQLYLRLLDTGTELAARVPQKDLAAYIGVTPVGLNRIARRTAQKCLSGIRSK
ncbi:Crp/Fnr family transcriptional regulator [Massilia endophytica]|uniref:Crp/Fnr family transcriptional regulator n=1 Tax=Massilia endophytica TaxID=2899220 RepID=UPI001E60AE11|nr:Crp/Fnr family transcriptional regulator [Massilia endophytica]UGQ46845.1 Crp/Fnr family transcriptional regulator [Massilia endophytica]